MNRKIPESSPKSTIESRLFLPGALMVDSGLESAIASVCVCIIVTGSALKFNSTSVPTAVAPLFGFDAFMRFRLALKLEAEVDPEVELETLEVLFPVVARGIFLVSRLPRAVSSDAVLAWVGGTETGENAEEEMALDRLRYAIVLSLLGNNCRVMSEVM
jgi:hypothetical protein